MALDVVSLQLTPWLGGAARDAAVADCPAEPGAETAEKKLAQTLRSRSPDATDTLPTHGVPTEVRPLLDALNHLFARTQLER